MAAVLDEIDRKILDLLQRDARMTNAAIAAQVGLTAPSVFERIRKLEQRGVIRGYKAILDAAAVGRQLTAFTRLTVTYDDRYTAGVEAISRDPDVLECYHVAGEDCLIVKTKVASPADLEGLLKRIRSRITVQRSVTMIALAVIKEEAPLNVLAARADTDNPSALSRDLGRQNSS
jgi:Lrp/AsnC family leucine-responsive transcriptional regulator